MVIFIIQQLQKGFYYLTVSSIGYTTYQQKITVNKNIQLGNIELNKSSEALAEVSVKAEKPIVQVLADKTVFNVENTINAAGSSGWELLRKAPGVIIDNNSNVILEGKTGVQIYIDGKLSQLRGTDLQSFLESLQASDIESIEIITQPSSKYDAAGTAGIINIKLKKDKNLGTNGTVTAALTVGAFARSTASASFNNRTRKNNFYGSYSNRVGKSTGFINLLREQNGTAFDARTTSIYDPESHNFRVGYDFYASATSTFGVLINANLNDVASTSNSRTPIRPVGSSMIDSILVANNRNSSETQNYSVNLNYQFQDSTGHSLTLDLDYGKYLRDATALQPNFYYTASETDILSQNITRQVTPTDIIIGAFKADYEQNLWNGKLALGVKFSLVETTNTFNFYQQQNEQFQLDESQSNSFAYEEIINAAYFNYNVKFGKWSTQLGLRAENTLSDGRLESSDTIKNDRVKRNYTNIFPSGGLTYQWNRKNQFALTYSKRIERPNYSSLNPFEYKIDELSFRRGNPFLQPQYTDNIKISHTYNYRLTTSLSYSYISDFFAQVTEAEGENKNFISQRNIANQEVINLAISYPFSFTKWWAVYLSINAYQSSYQATNSNFVALTQETLSFYAQNTFNLPYDFSMEISGWFSSPSVWGGTYETNALGALNVAFQKKFFSDKLNARLSFNDVLYTIPWSGTTRFGDLYIDGSGGNDSRNVAFSLSYNFGNKEVKKVRSRKTSSEDVQGRVD